ncbi:MAG: hypothetical protein ACLGHQ_12870, partial [Acidimicrobiia bacterium]
MYRSLFAIEQDGVDVTIRDLQATSGVSALFGGAIDMDSVGGVLRLDGVVIANNSSGYGGGINAADGTVVVVDTVIRGNAATTTGGGIWLGPTVTLTMVNTLLTGNTGLVGALRNAAGVVSLTNTTVVDNTATSG